MSKKETTLPSDELDKPSWKKFIAFLVEESIFFLLGRFWKEIKKSWK